MRVAQLIETLRTGGAEKLAVDIAGARLDCGDDSFLITLAELGPLSAGIRPGVVVHNLGMIPDHRLSQVETLFRFRKLCRQLNLDALQTHLPRANFFGLALAMSSGIPVFPTVHNNREFDYGHHAGSLRQGLRKWAYRRMLVHGKGMIAVSAAVKETLIEELSLNGEYAERIVVVPNGVAIPSPLDNMEKAETRRKFGIPEDCPLLVGVGRLTPQKNFKDLILALAKLGDTISTWRCVIAGDGPLEAELKDLIRTTGQEGKIQLIGRISQVEKLLGAADVFCMSSLWEGLPLALLEAMAVGLPVAAYAIDGVGEVVVDGESGWLASVGQVDELTGVLNRLLKDPDMRAKLGSAAREFVIAEHSFKKMTARLDAVYRGNQRRGT